MNYPERLYKYVCSDYLESTVDRGQLLFRNFTYFKQREDKTRGDYLEGSHRDNPDNNILIRRPTDGFAKEYDASFINSTNSDDIFMFCMSVKFEEKLFEEFECDSCIEITNPEELCSRTRKVIRKKISTHKKGLLSGFVKYYKPNEPTGEDITDATVLPFLKDEIYANQEEFRLVYGTRKAFKLVRRVVLNRHNFRAEAMKGTPKSKTIAIGSIADITKIRYSG